MGYVYRPHQCRLPNLENPFRRKKQGMIWRCRKCGSCWEYTHTVNHSWDRWTHHWTRVTDPTWAK